MYKGANVTAETIGSIRELVIEFLPSKLGKLLRGKKQTVIYRSNGEYWYVFVTGERVERSMEQGLERLWVHYHKHMGSPE